MLTQHSHTIAMMNRDKRTAYLLRDYFDLPRHISLLPALLQKGLGQADVVLALLRLRDGRTNYSPIFRSYIELLVGRKLTVGPPCLQGYNVPLPLPERTRSVEDRRITHVHATNPRQPQTEAHLRWSEYKVGRTLAQLHVRGVTKRDIRKAIARGWIKVEEMEAA
jgi:hypothetical protein